jgi:hypothetical protein
VKEHGLYKGGHYSVRRASTACVRNQGPQTYMTGGVPNTKLIPVALSDIIKIIQILF